MSHVAVVGLSMVDLVSVVVVAVMRVGLLALRTGPVPLTQSWCHSLLAWDIVSLHEGHARQQRLAAQQPSLVMQTKCQSKSRAVKIWNKSHLIFIWLPFVTLTISTIGLLFMCNKSTIRKSFYINKPFQISVISDISDNKIIIFAMIAQALVGWRGRCKKRNRETGTRMFLEMKSDLHWPISYDLEPSCWNGVSSSLFECVCVWGKIRRGGFTQD